MDIHLGLGSVERWHRARLTRWTFDILYHVHDQIRKAIRWFRSMSKRLVFPLTSVTSCVDNRLFCAETADIPYDAYTAFSRSQLSTTWVKRLALPIVKIKLSTVSSVSNIPGSFNGLLLNTGRYKCPSCSVPVASGLPKLSRKVKRGKPLQLSTSNLRSMAWKPLCNIF